MRVNKVFLTIMFIGFFFTISVQGQTTLYNCKVTKIIVCDDSESPTFESLVHFQPINDPSTDIQCQLIKNRTEENKRLLATCLWAIANDATVDFTKETDCRLKAIAIKK